MSEQPACSKLWVVGHIVPKDECSLGESSSDVEQTAKQRCCVPRHRPAHPPPRHRPPLLDETVDFIVSESRTVDVLSTACGAAASETGRRLKARMLPLTLRAAWEGRCQVVVDENDVFRGFSKGIRLVGCPCHVGRLVELVEQWNVFGSSRAGSSYTGMRSGLPQALTGPIGGWRYIMCQRRRCPLTLSWKCSYEEAVAESDLCYCTDLRRYVFTCKFIHISSTSPIPKITELPAPAFFPCITPFLCFF